MIMENLFLLTMNKIKSRRKKKQRMEMSMDHLLLLNMRKKKLINQK